ncbi:MAG: ribosomal protein S18 acetylase RimI-like enzyme [Paracoccaceae bacterium]|jgi:ribosomal protein S18 acetylase RimI-like enzyme
MMQDIAIRPAVYADAAALTEALKLLAINLEDPWRSSVEQVRAHGFGPDRSFHACIAKAPGMEGLAGVAVFSPVFSTSRGTPGLYVSDLWAAAEARGNNLGRRLLAAAGAEARAQWGARWLKLSVHKDNPRARVFYDRLGFVSDDKFETLMLEIAQTQALGDTE